MIRSQTARRLALAAGLAAMTAVPALGQTEDTREGYYYPEVGSEEVFDRDIGQGPPTNRLTRVAFVTELTRQQHAAQTPPRIAIFAKGAEAEHMIITALEPGIFESLFRARAVLAQLTATARQAEIFTKTSMAADVTWFDLVKLLGFEDIVVTDGVSWAHRVVLK